MVILPAAIVRPPGAAPLGVPFPCRYIPADANSGLCIGRSRAGHRGLGGHRPPTSGTGYIPGHCLLVQCSQREAGGWHSELHLDAGYNNIVAKRERKWQNCLLGFPKGITLEVDRPFILQERQ